MSRSVLVTGAARGIGRATVLALAASGWDVHAGVRKAADGEELVKAADSGKVTPIELDVTNEAQIAALPGVLPGGLDALVNNAGVVVGGPVESLTTEGLRHQFDVNVTGQVAVTRAVLPLLRERTGRIVFISSVSGRVATPMMGAYNASKFALEAIADALRGELRPWKIPVILIEPGSIDTDLWRLAGETTDETVAAMDPVHRELYAGHFDGMRKTVGRIQKQTSPVEKVVAAIERGLDAKRPRARYLVGTDARAQVVLSSLPTAVSDLAFAKAMGTPGSPPRS